jgi:hypothetical protein
VARQTGGEKKMPPHVTYSGIHKPQATGITVAYYMDNGRGGESLNPPEPYRNNLSGKGCPQETDFFVR